MVGLETQADGSVTPLPRLAGVLDQRQRFIIHGWNAERDNKYSYAGHNQFLGSLVLNAAADYTLLSYYYMLDRWNAEWAQDGSSVKLSFKDDKNLSLNFEFKPGAPQKRVLICIIDNVMLDKLCSVNVKVNNLKTESEVSKREFDKAIEALRFHIIFVHPSDELAIKFIECNCLMGSLSM